MFRPGTIAVILFSAALFFVVRQFLIKWGLVDRRRSSMTHGDFGLQKLFAWGAYFVLWIVPSFIAWNLLELARDFGWLR